MVFDRIRLFFALAVFAAGPAFADSKLLLSGVLADSSVAAPVLHFRSASDRGTTWHVGLIGWTLDGSWKKRLDRRRSLVFQAELTPMNAHSSNLVYREGQRDKTLEYENGAYLLKAGWLYDHSGRWHSAISLVGLQELVSNLDAGLEHTWESPYLGVELVETYRRVVAEDILLGRIEGIQIRGTAQMFEGDQPWSRLHLAESAGKRVGNLLFTETLALMAGHSLNTVSQFLIGGSWDLPAGNTLYGYRYGEFRVDRAMTINAGVDYDWERVSAGLRGSYLESPQVGTAGYMVTVGTVWKGVAGRVGLAFGEQRDPMVVVAITTARFRP